MFNFLSLWISINTFAIIAIAEFFCLSSLLLCSRWVSGFFYLFVEWKKKPRCLINCSLSTRYITNIYIVNRMISFTPNRNVQIYLLRGSSRKTFFNIFQYFTLTLYASKLNQHNTSFRYNEGYVIWNNIYCTGVLKILFWFLCFNKFELINF